ncbi:MAG: hypothetical protein LBV36_03440 [Chromatiales bacterium]|nr:hypothetical protein [Chromatiales bacterium]
MFRTVFLTAALMLLTTTTVVSQAAAPAVTGRPNFIAGKDAAVYVWREANGMWRLRLASGSATHTFQGGVSVEKVALTSATLANTEADDVLRRSYPGQAEFELHVGGNDYLDGVDFSAPADAGLCLWGWGSLGKTVRVGPSGALMTLPIDLLGTGACGKSNGSTVPVTPAKPAMKYHPGHYIALNDWDGPVQMIEAVQPGVQGFLKRYTWLSLEPQFGVYDFSQIQTDLVLARDHGMQLVVMIEDKSFDPSVRLTPRYLWESNTLPYLDGGQVAKRWAPWVVERMAALTQAMGARFDSDPSFEGVAFQESAMGFSDAVKKQYGYTPEKYRDAIISVLTNTRKHFPTSQVFWFQNYLEGAQAYIGTIAATVAPLRIAMGGPDILPDSVPLNYHNYPYYEQYKDKMTLFGSIQYDSYKHLHATAGYATKYWTMPEMFRYSRDKLHVKYLFWTRKPKPDPADSYDWTQALPVIKSNPTFN